MEFSNLLGKISNKDNVPHQFLALELTDDIVQAAVWQVAGETTEVVSLGTPIPWNGDAGHVDELVGAVDSTITKAVGEITTTPTQVIFGIPTTWLDGEMVSAGKKPYIKKICTDLELKPLGFVVIMDSLVRYLRMQEGTPATAILIQVADTELTIASVVLGKTHASQSLPRTDDVTKDVELGLTHCVQGLSQLPSRFIVFDGMHDLEEVVQNLTLVDWKNKFPFIHIPKVEALNKDIVIKALCVAGGAEVARSIGFSIKEESEDVAEVVEPEPVVPSEEVVEEVDEPAVAEPELTDLTSLGFSADNDNLSPATYEDSVDDSLVVEPPRRASSFRLPHVAIPHFALPHLSLPHLTHFPLWGVLAVVVFAVLFFALAASLWLFPKATVTIAVTPRLESAEFTLKLDPETTAIDEGAFTVPVQSVETSVTDSGSIATTGTKQIGDPSTGEVTLYNRTSQKKTFAKGTVLTAGSLKFTLDSEVSVASKSAGSDYVDVPGKATAKVTASAIGESGNLKAGTEFVVATFSQDSYIGKNEAALKGGNSKDIAAVSAKDMANLEAELTSKLETKAKEQLQGDSGLVYILPDSAEVIEEDYSSKVGAEATTLEATLTVQIQGYSLSPVDVGVFAKTILAQKLEGKYEFEGSPKLTVQGGDKTSVNIKAEISVLPRVDTDATRNALRGLKNASDIEQVVSAIPGYAAVKVSITPSWLPPKLKSLPRKSENISLQVVAAQ